MSAWKIDIKNTFTKSERCFTVPNKLLVGAGPTNYSPRVMASLCQQGVGPISREIYQLQDDIKQMLKYVFQTQNEVTLAIQASGSGGIEAAISSTVDPGEKIIVAVSGFWGDRIIEIAKHRGCNVIRLESEPGEVFTLEELENEIIKHRPVSLFMTHGETSATVIQPLEGLADICHKHDCLLAVDAVVTLGGVPYFADRWGIDISVSAAQKCIGGPPGMAFLTCSSKAVARMRSIKKSPPFYFDVLAIADTWNCFEKPARYYVTYNSNLFYAVREALTEIVESDLENVWDKHKICVERFWDGIEKMNLKLYVPKPENRLGTVTAVYLPSGINWRDLFHYINQKYNMEISFGMGPSYNKAIRIGFMGYNARPEVVDYVLKVLNDGFKYCQMEDGQNNSKLNPYYLL